MADMRMSAPQLYANAELIQGPALMSVPPDHRSRAMVISSSQALTPSTLRHGTLAGARLRTLRRPLGRAKPQSHGPF